MSEVWLRGVQGTIPNGDRGGRKRIQNQSQGRCSSTVAMSATATAVGADPKLLSVREEMKKAGGLAALVVPTSDPHILECPPAHQKRREFISGFTGTAGTAVITPEKAALWTDGRYFLQAADELGPDWTLMKAGTPDCPTEL
ncbi:hypothetical protein BSKO_09805 [Bryopsis sp. KO-2023]|nr:hypothetical protein BSKO_09805 [Bryopsis sp. KO-2023]